MNRFYEGVMDGMSAPLFLFRQPDYNRYQEQLDEAETILKERERKLFELMESQ